MPTNTPNSRALKAAALSILFAGTSVGGVAKAHSLPLGDASVTTHPEVGGLYSCQTRFNPNAPGANGDAFWINEAAGTWDPDIKPVIEGSVTWPGEINITIRGDERVITGNGLPDHQTGQFPVTRNSAAYQYDRNPNSIREQDILLILDVTPQLAAQPTCVPMGMIGFALSGAAIYNAIDARGRDAPAHELQDACNGHPQQQGEYHYHDLSPCLTDTKSGPDGHSDLLGYALDGFGIYGPSENETTDLASADLDECHGHVGWVEWDGELVEMYHYHFTEDYPYTLGCFTGEVTQSDASLRNRGNGNPSGIGQPQNRAARGQAIMEVVAERLNVDMHRLVQLAGGPPPDHRQIARGLGIDVRDVRAAFEAARRQAGR